MLPLASRFDSIIIGFNKSDLQESDARVIGGDCPKNVRTVFQPATLMPPQHLAALIEKIETDYVLFLCHDDYLLEDGVVALRKLIDEKAGLKMAVFGSHRWGESESTYRGVTRELQVYAEGLSVEQFVLADMDHAFAFTLSGLASHVDTLRKRLPEIRIFDKGFRLDNLMVTAPGTNRVFQTDVPLVEIRLHTDQEGRQPQVRARIIDNMSFYFIHALYARDELLVKRAVEQIMTYAAHAARPFVLVHLARLLLASASWSGTKSYRTCFKFLSSWLLTSFPAKLRNAVSKKLLRRT